MVAVQGRIRGWLSRSHGKRAAMERAQERAREQAAVTVQRHYRGWRDRGVVQRLRALALVQRLAHLDHERRGGRESAHHHVMRVCVIVRRGGGGRAVTVVPNCPLVYSLRRDDDRLDGRGAPNRGRSLSLFLRLSPQSPKTTLLLRIVHTRGQGAIARARGCMCGRMCVNGETEEGYLLLHLFITFLGNIHPNLSV